MIIGTKIEFENLADFILRDYLGNKYDSYIPFDVQAFAKDYLKLEISYSVFEEEHMIEGLRTGNQIILDHRLQDTSRGEHSGVLEKAEEGPRAVLTPDREKIRQQGRRMKDPEEPMFTLTTQDLHGIADNDRIRKLMPIECWRLQGFTDEQFNKARASGLSDARLYKMAGNAVSVPVITELGAIIKRVHENSQKEADNG